MKSEQNKNRQGGFYFWPKTTNPTQGDPVISGESGALSSGAQPVKSQKP